MTNARTPLALLTALALTGAARLATADTVTPRLYFTHVKTDGGLTSWRASMRLRRYRYSASSCKPARHFTGRLAGSVKVKAKVTASGLAIQSFTASGKHSKLRRCLRRAAARWDLSNTQSEEGTKLSFEMYLSTSSLGVLGALRGSGSGRGSGSLGLVGGTGSGRSYRSRYGPYYRSNATLSNVSSSGSLQQGIVTWALQQLRLEQNARYCQQRSAKKDPSVKGKLSFSLRVGKNGGVEKLELVQDSVNNVQMQSCVMRYLISYSSYRSATPFPASKGTTTVKLSLDFPKATKRN